jgi:hypothetical protein
VVIQKYQVPSERSSDIKTIVLDSGHADKKSWFADNVTATILGVFTGVALIIGAATGVVSQVKPLRDGVCSLRLFWFCDGGDLVSRQEQEEWTTLHSIGFNETKLKTLDRDAKTPKVQKESQRRLAVIATEQNGYDTVKNDIAGLTEFVSKPCEACLVQDTAVNQLKQLLKEDQAVQKETERLQSAGFDKVDLTILARDAKTPKVQKRSAAQAHRHCDGTEWL